MAGGTHPASAKSIPVFFPKHFIWNSCLADFLRLCLAVQSTYFQSISFGPSLKKEPAKCLLIWHKNCSHRLKQVLGSWPKIYKNFYLRCFHTGLFYIVTINILKPSHHDRIKAPQSVSADSLTARSSLSFSFSFVP